MSDDARKPTLEERVAELEAVVYELTSGQWLTEGDTSRALMLAFQTRVRNRERAA